MMKRSSTVRLEKKDSLFLVQFFTISMMIFGVICPWLSLSFSLIQFCAISMIIFRNIRSYFMSKWINRKCGAIFRCMMKMMMRFSGRNLCELYRMNCRNRGKQTECKLVGRILIWMTLFDRRRRRRRGGRDTVTKLDLFDDIVSVKSNTWRREWCYFYQFAIV